MAEGGGGHDRGGSSSWNDFRFVNLDLSGGRANSRGRQKESVKKIVRANAARHQWRRGGGKKSVNARAATGAKELADVELPRVEPDAEEAETETGLSRAQIRAVQTMTMYKASVPDVSRHLTTSTDEFLFRFNIHHILPGILPDLTSGVDHPGAHKWAHLAMTNAALFYVWQHAATLYYRMTQSNPSFGVGLNLALRGRRGNSRAENAILTDVSRSSLISNQSHIVGLLNRQLADPKHMSSDATILAIAGLASYGWDEDGAPTDSIERLNPINLAAPNQGPMRSLQSLFIHGSFPHVKIHMDGLEMIVKMRGGLDSIKTEGLASLVSAIGVKEATRNIMKPRYPFASLFPKDMQNPEMLLKHPLDMLGLFPLKHSFDGGLLFPAAWIECDLEFFQNLYCVLIEMRNFTMRISLHTEGSTQESLAVMADTRNFIQHSLLSLPDIGAYLLSAQDLPTDPDINLYEPARLAAQIYSLLVIFPLSPVTAPFKTLATRLQALLSSLDIMNRSMTEMDLIMWMLVMGGIGATGSRALRSWFVVTLVAYERLHQSLRGSAGDPHDTELDHPDYVYHDLGIRSWEEIRRLMCGFLWLQSTNDMDGLKLWTEVALMEQRQARIYTQSK